MTDHALLRYLERFEQVDIQAARTRLEHRLSTGRIPELLDFVGDAEFRIRLGRDTFCGRGGRIVTCWRDEGDPKAAPNPIRGPLETGSHDV
ncbi:MAG: hypothetical protein OXK76_16305 [Gammaproteobacteria bacterium]|nr:hypothetical protein [Gammaproteobacteria bacterium]